MEILVITFESALDASEVETLFTERMDHYREMEGLLQKYYLHDAEDGRTGGIYVFESAEARDAMLDSDVHESIREAYEAEAIEMETFPVVFPLREVAGTTPS